MQESNKVANANKFNPKSEPTKLFLPQPGDKIICNNGEEFICCTLETLKDKSLGRADIADADFFGYSKRSKNGWMYWTVETLNGNGDWCAKEIITAEQEVKQEVTEVIDDKKEEVKEEPRYTVEEVLEAIQLVTPNEAPWNWVPEIKEHLNKINSPEYQEYLRLKAIYE